jgi:hypothetical protein
VKYGLNTVVHTVKEKERKERKYIKIIKLVMAIAIDVKAWRRIANIRQSSE